MIHTHVLHKGGHGADVKAIGSLLYLFALFTLASIPYLKTTREILCYGKSKP